MKKHQQENDFLDENDPRVFRPMSLYRRLERLEEKLFEEKGWTTTMMTGIQVVFRLHPFGERSQAYEYFTNGFSMHICWLDEEIPHVDEFWLK